MSAPPRLAGCATLILGCAVLFACTPTSRDGAPGPITPTAPPGPQLRIALHVQNPVLRLGDQLRFTAMLFNDGAAPVIVALPGDGSAAGWRSPVVSWTPHCPPQERCGNINALRPDGVIELAAGGSVPLAWLGQPTFDKTGTWPVSVEVRHVPAMEWGGLSLGQHDAATMTKLRQAPAFVATSNVVEVRVEG